MAKTKISCLIVLAFIAISMLATEVLAYHEKYGPGSLKPYQCFGRCSFRCSKSSHHKQCMFYCQKCCSKCLCVPPGTSGHKWTCPCYNNWKTQEGRPKCP